MQTDNIYITKPILPELTDFISGVQHLFESGQLTNMGSLHNELESKLKDELFVKNFSLFNNGTTALFSALKILNLPFGSEVITTPYTFSATVHSIVLCGLKPVFCDIEPDTMCIDTNKIEKLITDKTSAILGVHVYGFPCDVFKIDKIAKKYNLKVIYDGAHVFSTKINGKGIGNFGDITMFSFHATKLFHTVEGGGLAYVDENLKSKINKFRNFGIVSEDVVEGIGFNGKMNEIQALMGLKNLEIYKSEQEKRKVLRKFYDEKLNIKGIRIPKMPKNVSDSYQYYPIIIGDDYPYSRDEVIKKLRDKNIYARKYFYPACSDYDCYKNIDGINQLYVVNDIKNRVLCLPYYGNLEHNIRDLICEVICDV